MAAVHLQTTVATDGTLVVHGLPTLAGHKVDVLVRDCSPAPHRDTPYPLHGKPVHYVDPFDSVAQDDWNALP